jgi:hypothetical protein
VAFIKAEIIISMKIQTSFSLLFYLEHPQKTAIPKNLVDVYAIRLVFIAYTLNSEQLFPNSLREVPGNSLRVRVKIFCNGVLHYDHQPKISLH